MTLPSLVENIICKIFLVLEEKVLEQTMNSRVFINRDEQIQ